MKTLLSPQQRRNFIVEHHDYYGDGNISPVIDNSQQRIVHIISYNSDPFVSGPIVQIPPTSVNIRIDVGDLPENQKQAYLIRDNVCLVYANIMNANFTRGEFRTDWGQALIIEAVNIDGEIYVEGKNYT